MQQASTSLRQCSSANDLAFFAPIKAVEAKAQAGREGGGEEGAVTRPTRPKVQAAAAFAATATLAQSADQE